MRFGKLLVVVGVVGLLIACGNDDKRDDSILDMSYLTGKDWYYNAWLGEKYAYEKSDGLEILRLEKNGVLKEMDFSGRRETVVGKWSSKNNEITLEYDNRDQVVWNVLHSGSEYIRTIVNGQGERQYTTEPGYLNNLSADAFLVNEYSAGNRFQTHIGVEVQGNNNVRECALIPFVDQMIPLENHGYYWTERTPVQSDYIEFTGQPQKVRFYVRIGKNDNLKLSDQIYAGNLPERHPDEVALTAGNTGGVTNLTVTWDTYGRNDVYYRVEVFSKDKNLMNPYFVSRIQPGGSSRLVVSPTTAGEVNRMKELRSGESYLVRLSAILYEPGVDIINDEYGYVNVQAISYFTKLIVWE